MRKDLTEIVLVVDRSGSMESCRTDAEGGINAFVEQQRSKRSSDGKTEMIGEARLTLVQFDTEYQFVHRGVRIEDVPQFRLFPRGYTALLDAVGRAIRETGERLSNLAEAERPGLVVVVIVTDGQENSSKEFTQDAVRKMIEHQQQAYGWQFTFLGADEFATSTAVSYGIAPQNAASYDKANVMRAFQSTSCNVAAARGALNAGETFGTVAACLNYTEKQRASYVSSPYSAEPQS